MNAESQIRPLTCTPMSTLRTSPFCSTEIIQVSDCDIKHAFIHTNSISSIRRIMCGSIVQTQASGETDPGFQAIFFYQSPSTILDILSYLSHGHAWSDVLACMLSHHSMDLGSSPDILVCGLWILVRQFFHMSLFFRGYPPGVTA